MPRTSETAVLIDVLRAARRRIVALREALEAMVGQHCTDGDRLDSMACGANALAMEVLADEGRIVIEPPIVGRRVIAHWVKERGEEGQDRAEAK